MGVSALLPGLHARVKKATKLLTQGPSSPLKSSQRVNLLLILRSLNNPSVISNLLPLATSPAERKDSGGSEEVDKIQLAGDVVNLMRVLLKQLGQEFANKLESIEEDGKSSVNQPNVSLLKTARNGCGFAWFPFIGQEQMA